MNMESRGPWRPRFENREMWGSLSRDGAEVGQPAPSDSPCDERVGQPPTGFIVRF